MVIRLYNHTNIKIKFCLVFFSTLFLLNCKKSEANYGFIYDNNTIQSVYFADDLSSDYKIVLIGKSNAILGGFSTKNDTLFYTPVIPFSEGETYQILKKDVVLGEFKVHISRIKEQVVLQDMYPLTDTVPENLLKVYLVFSKPMQQVQNALNFIKVIDENTQKEVDIFLSLETELWNKEHTEFTLWLDPGRIKKDLIPNKKLGNPLQKQHTYKIIIDKNWLSAKGNPLDKEYQKKLYVVDKKAVKPAIGEIQITKPTANTLQKMIMNFNQKIDMMLIDKNVSFYDDKYNTVEGEFTFLKGSKNVIFTPKQIWKKGNYSIEIKSSLEDLAGNNFNRLFDTDLQNNTSENKKRRIIQFTI